MNTPAALSTGAEPYIASFYTTLWLKALMLAGNARLEPFTDDLDDLELEFFRLYRPLAKA